MLKKLKSKIKGFFVEDESNLSPTERNLKVVEEINKDFNNSYNKLKKLKDINEFSNQAINLVLKKIEQTQYGQHKDFIYEIKYLIHYLFLILYDDQTYGDNVFRKQLTEVDNYIFSSYRRHQELAVNIKKLSTLACSNRFTKNPKENILSYMVFLEENNIEIIEILQDYCLILDNKGFIDGAFSKFKFKKSSSNKESKGETKENTMLSKRTFVSIAPTLDESSINAKFKIQKDNLKD